MIIIYHCRMCSVNAVSRRESIFGFNIGNADSDEDMDDDVQGVDHSAAGHHNMAPPPVQVHHNFQHNAVFGHLNPPPQATHVNHHQQHHQQQHQPHQRRRRQR